MIYSRSKLSKYRRLSDSDSLKRMQPETHSFTKANFWALMNKYGEAIVKPAGGWGGMGVMLVSAVGNGEYELHGEAKKRKFSSRERVYAYVAGKTKHARHMVQRRIHLAKVRGRPFDIRVMLQRKKGRDWTVTGRLAKIAGPGYFITNVARSKGRVAPLSDVLRKSNITGVPFDQLEREIDRVSMLAVRKLQQYYKIDTVGLDIGLDQFGGIWIIEPNFTPSIALFYKLKDKSMYRKIKSFQRK